MVSANSNLFDAGWTLTVMPVILAIVCIAHFVAGATAYMHPSARGLSVFSCALPPSWPCLEPAFEDGRALMVLRRITLRGCLRPLRFITSNTAIAF